MNSYLNIKSLFNLLESSLDIGKLLSKANEYGYKNIAINDKNTLCYAAVLNKDAKKYGIKPIYALTFDTKIDNDIFSISFYAKNNEGYLNLLKLSSYLNTNKNIIDFQDLINFNNNVITIIDIDNFKLIYHKDEFRNFFNRLKSFFKNFYLGVNKLDIAHNQIIYEKLKEIASESEFVMFDVVTFLNKEDHIQKQVIDSIRKNEYFIDQNKDYYQNEYFKNKLELEKIYTKSEIKNSDVIASMCNVALDFLKTDLPQYQNNKNLSSQSYLIALCKTGLKYRNKLNEKYNKRLKYELEIIIKMNFTNYFLIVYDYVSFARRNGILCTPRGSSAASLVSYVLGINDIDPLEHDLIFERFLNPERITMPDIDIDFEDERRDEVIDYIVNKYGYDNVAHIVTFQTLKAKAALRDCAKILKYTNDEINAIMKVVPNDLKLNLSEMYQNSKLFKNKIDSSNRNRELLKLSISVEGLYKNYSTHAAGVVISSTSLQEVVGVLKLENSILNTQIQMEYLENYGLIKFDLLALRNLTALREIVDNIKLIDQDFKLEKIPFDDVKTFNLIKEAKTLGIFQLESSGMRQLIRRVKPNNINDISLTVALFRPGAMGNIDLFLANRNSNKINYIHEDLKDILAETSGIIIYQEQIMAISYKMAGFSFSKADILRKAMSKKNKGELESLKQDFFEGSLKKGYSLETVETIYEWILKFAEYGFNKAHSVLYAYMVYKLAYLKANYPLYFYTSILNNHIGSEAKTFEYILEAKSSNIEFFKLDINLSSDKYYIKDNKIVPPLTLIKGISYNTVENIKKSLIKNDGFKNYDDAVYCLANEKIDKNNIEAMIKVGAFDCFNYNRATMLSNLDILYKHFKSGYQTRNLIGKPIYILNTFAKDRYQESEDERSFLGFNFDGNLINEIKQKYRFDTEIFSTLRSKRKNICGFGRVDKIKEHRTKNGDLMAFVKVSDDSGSLDLVLMPNKYHIFKTNILNLSKDRIFIYFIGDSDKEGSVLVRKCEVYSE